MENSYLNIATGAGYTAADMRAAYNADYLPTVAAGDTPMNFSAWLYEIAAAGDFIAVPAGAAYMVTIDFEDGATFYGPGDIAALAADVAGLIDDYNPADIAGKVWRLWPGGRAYFDFVNVARIQ